MNAHIKHLGQSSPADIRRDQIKQCDFSCESCGEEFDRPHQRWVSRVNCPQCNEIVEAR